MQMPGAKAKMSAIAQIKALQRRPARFSVASMSQRLEVPTELAKRSWPFWASTASMDFGGVKPGLSFSGGFLKKPTLCPAADLRVSFSPGVPFRVSHN
jgi:hypothetical protein